MQLDYTITSLDERKQIVEKVVAENAETPEKLNLEQLADYLIMCMEKEEKKEKKILTENRSVTINKRETSFEGLVEKIEGGENALYHMEKTDKNMLLQPRRVLKSKEIAAIPELQQIKNSIDELKSLKPATPRDVYLIKKATIELYKDLYIVYAALTQPVKTMKIQSSKHPTYLEGISLADPEVVESILCNYSRLKEDSWDDFLSDTWYMMIDFDRLLTIALADKPHYELIVQMKIDGAQNHEIQEQLQLKFGLNYSREYISSLWRCRIPAMIALVQQRLWLDWAFEHIAKVPKKKCNRCGQEKFRNDFYFSKDRSKKDGYYTICKECRKQKGLK